jgi:hypothetical protein
MSDFPKGPQVPLPGSPTYTSPEGDNASNHPSLADTSPDTPQDWDQTAMTRWLTETTAEREGISSSEALNQIRGGAEGQGEYTKPRSETKLGEAGWARWQGE